MSDLYLDKKSTLGLYLMNESNNVDLESVDSLMRPIVALLTAKTSVISRFSCEGHLQEVDDSSESYEESYLMLTGDANDHTFVQHWLNKIQTKLQDGETIRCKLEFNLAVVLDMDESPHWYPSFTIRSREHYGVSEVEEYHKVMLETLEELINDPVIGKLVNKFPTADETITVPEHPIANVIDKGDMQITVSKYPTDKYGRPVDTKGRPLY